MEGYVVIGIVLAGLLVGALGRLAVPGRTPMALWMTALVGVGGIVLGGLVGWLLGFEAAAVTGMVLAVPAAASIVLFVERNRTREGGQAGDGGAAHLGMRAIGSIVAVTLMWAGLLVVGFFVLLFISLNSWANSK